MTSHRAASPARPAHRRWTRTRRRQAFVAAAAIAIGAGFAIHGVASAAPQTLSVGATGSYKTIQSALNAAKAGDTVEVSAGTYAEALKFPTSGSASTGYITLRSKAGAKVVVDGKNSLKSGNGLVSLDGRSYIKIAGLTITNSPTHGIYGNQASNIQISDTEVSNTRNGGLVLLNGANAVIDGNNVHHTNQAGTSASNEAMSLVNYDTVDIRNNEVHDSGEEGIDVKYETRNALVHGNRVYNNRGPNIYADSVHDVKIFDNIVSGATNTSKPGILVAVESYSPTKRLSNVDIYNNVLTGNAGGGIGLWKEGSGTMSNIRILNNVAYNNKRAGIVFSTSGFSGTNIIRNNILTGNPSATSGGTNGFTIDHNLTTGDAKFVNAAGGDFHLQPGSPAIDAGVATLAPTVDIAGTARPKGGAVDVGVYER
ncbi:MAG: hypothetical protein ABS81_29360 [Pseudonocardia sp. SCN 72-86]|nr:MAG: hypothetical protein ABS81_29360 [Pseudonocardia sp. SCN 72-86]